MKQRYCIIALFITLSAAVSSLPGTAFAGRDESPAVKTFLDTSLLVNKEDESGNTVVSGWDLNESGGRVLPYAGLQMIDTSHMFPVEAVRDIDEITFGEITFEFCVSLNQTMPGAAIRFADGFADSIAFDFKQDGLYLRANGENLFLSAVAANTDLRIKALIDFESKKATAYVNGLEVLKNADFTIPAPIDRIIVSTGEKAVGAFTLKNIRVHRGYAINDLTVSPGLDAAAGDVTISKPFAPQSGVLVWEFQTRLPQKRGGVVFTLQSGAATVFTIEARGDGYFYCMTNTALGAYTQDMWQHFRVTLDMPSRLANVQINGKTVRESIPIGNAAFVDCFELFVEQNADGPIFAEDFLLYKEEAVTDYPPAPVKANSNGVAIGIQSCPLWTEGRHYGWDWINSAAPRVPLLGFYDEASAESVDWEMKFMAEHGIDFQWICWYMPGAAGKPIKDTNASPYIHNGYFNARYSSYVQFAVFWENVANYPWTEDRAYNREMFLKHVAPFWIEYYFKDPRYFKTNGRPLLGIYRLGEFRSAFGTDFAELGAFMTEFKQMCVNAGVGAPFVVLQEYPNVDFENEGAHYALQTQMKFDAFYTYSYSSNGWPHTQKTAHLLGRDKASLLRFIPTYCVGFDTFAWGGEPGVSLSPAQFEDMLRDGKENFLPTLPYSGLDERIIMLGSWNEYGEGHAIMPSAENGFGYLDAVRNVFAPGAHTDTAPTDEQKERINTAYPKGRSVEMRERSVCNEIPQNAFVTQGWYFDTSAEGWSAAAWQDGCLKISSASQITGLNVNSMDISHVRLRLKNQSDALALSFAYATNFQPAFKDNPAIQAYIGEASDAFIDVVIPISKYPTARRGIVKGLRLAFSGISSGQSVLIDSIEFFKTPQNGPVVSLDGAELESGAVLRGDKLYIPFFEAQDLLNFKYCIRTDGSIYFQGENGISVKIGGETAVNGAAYPNDDALLEIAGGLYLSAEAFSLLTNRAVTFNPQKLSISGEESVESAPPSAGNPWNSVFSYEFDNASIYDFYHYGDGFTGNSVTDGCWRVSKKMGKHAFLYMNNIAVAASGVKKLELAISATSAVNGGIYYQTSAAPGESESKKFSFSHSGDGEMKYFAFNTEGKAGWSGNITKLRLDLVGGAADCEVQIAYIRLIGDEAAFAKLFNCISLETSENVVPNLVTASVNGLRNNSFSQETVRLCIAVYEGDRLINIRLKRISVAPRDFIPRGRLSLYCLDDTYDVKAFLWTQGLVPVVMPNTN